MAAFAELDWRRIDVQAIVGCGGLASIDEERRPACIKWLVEREYKIDTFECQPGLSIAIPELGRLFRWEEQFGYALTSDRCNLDAVRDGFHFDIAQGEGRVLQILHPEVAWQEDAAWLTALLSIAQEQSRWQLALGCRFFALLVLPEGSPLIGAVIDQTAVPGPYFSPCREIHEFER